MKASSFVFALRCGISILVITSKFSNFPGIRVLLDYVPNHASTESNYFLRSELRDPVYDNYFIWADGRPDPNNETNTLVPSNWVRYFEHQYFTQ